MILQNNYTSLSQIILNIKSFIYCYIREDMQIVMRSMLEHIKDKDSLKAFCMWLYDFTILPKETTEQQALLQEFLKSWADNYAEYADLK